jgi:recombinational DNA repair protein RecR
LLLKPKTWVEKSAKCSYCKRFYSVQECDNIRRGRRRAAKILMPRNSVDRIKTELARNVTSESYFVDFSGHVTSLSELNEEHGLQSSCLKHLTAISAVRKSNSSSARKKQNKILAKKINSDTSKAKDIFA